MKDKLTKCKIRGASLYKDEVTQGKNSKIKVVLACIISSLITTSIGVGAIIYFTADQVSYTPADTSWKVTDTNTALNSLYSDSAAGKKLIATALTNKGVTTSNTASFSTMASNISSITTGTSGTWHFDVGKLVGYDSTNKKWYQPNAPTGILAFDFTLNADGTYSLSYAAGTVTASKK